MSQLDEKLIEYGEQGPYKEIGKKSKPNTRTISRDLDDENEKLLEI